MIVVSDSSPLISLSKIGRLDLLLQLYRTILITPEVYAEVVVTGAGLAGSAQVANSPWIEVHQSKKKSDFADAQHGLGMGETASILLAQELHADLFLADDLQARRSAKNIGLTVLGCVGILELAFHLKFLPDLTDAYKQLLSSGAYVNRKILDASLRSLELPPL